LKQLLSPSYISIKTRDHVRYNFHNFKIPKKMVSNLLVKLVTDYSLYMNKSNENEKKSSNHYEHVDDELFKKNKHILNRFKQPIEDLYNLTKIQPKIKNNRPDSLEEQVENKENEIRNNVSNGEDDNYYKTLKNDNKPVVIYDYDIEKNNENLENSTNIEVKQASSQFEPPFYNSEDLINKDIIKSDGNDQNVSQNENNNHETTENLSDNENLIKQSENQQNNQYKKLYGIKEEENEKEDHEVSKDYTSNAKTHSDAENDSKSEKKKVFNLKNQRRKSLNIPLSDFTKTIIEKESDNAEYSNFKKKFQKIFKIKDKKKKRTDSETKEDSPLSSPSSPSSPTSIQQTINDSLFLTSVLEDKETIDSFESSSSSDSDSSSELSLQSYSTRPTLRIENQDRFTNNVSLINSNTHRTLKNAYLIIIFLNICAVISLLVVLIF
jgi:hypothetical protein